MTDLKKIAAEMRLAAREDMWARSASAALLKYADALDALAAQEPMKVPDDLRAQGWAVAVHNDYRLNGEAHTFWLFTKGDQCIKGEGLTDKEALNACRAEVLRLNAAPQPAPPQPAVPESFAKALDYLAMCERAMHATSLHEPCFTDRREELNKARAEVARLYALASAAPQRMTVSREALDALYYDVHLTIEQWHGALRALGIEVE